MKKLSVLFADDADNISKRFCEYTNLGFDYRVCEKDGAVVLGELNKNPVDVIVIDFFMKGIDAFGVLERLKVMNPLYTPAVIVASSIDTPVFKNEFLKNGADYYLKKPVKTDELISIINDIKRIRETNSLTPATQRYFNDSEVIITYIIQQFCVPAHLKGYNYLRYAIKLCVEVPYYKNSVTKNLYPDIAQLYAVSPESVERNIRTAIASAWSNGGDEVFSKYFGYNQAIRKRCPTNAEFIARVSDEIRLKYNVVYSTAKSSCS